MKLALVTGGFKRIGAAIAARLAAEGWTLALHGAHSLVPSDRLADELKAAGAVWVPFHADLSVESEVVALLPAIAAHFDALPTLIVNNASLFEEDDASSVTAAVMAAHNAVNVVAPVLLATQLAQLMAADARGSIVNLLDQRIANPHGDQLSYTLSKQSLSGATATLARALAPKLRVNAVAPGLTLATPDYSDAQLAELAAMMPLGALPNPQAIADAVAWLAGAKSVTGQTIFVDGGAHMVSFARDFVHLGRDLGVSARGSARP